MSRTPYEVFTMVKNLVYLDGGNILDLPLLSQSDEKTNPDAAEVKAPIYKALSLLEPSGMYANPLMHPIGSLGDEKREAALLDLVEEYLVETKRIPGDNVCSGIIVQNGDYIAYVVLKLARNESCPVLDGFILHPPYSNGPTIRQLTNGQLQTLS